jgi:hypothetical protein
MDFTSALRSRQSLTATEVQERRHDPVYTVTSECPSCHGTLKLRQTKDNRHVYVSCSTRVCGFKAPYEPVLEKLRHRIARLEAEMQLNRLQGRT